MNLRTEKELALWCVQHAGVSEHIYNAVAEHVRPGAVREAGQGTRLEELHDEDWGLVRPLTLEQIAFEIGEMVALLRRSEEIGSNRSAERAHGRIIGLLYVLGLEAHVDETVRAEADAIYALFERLALEHDGDPRLLEIEPFGSPTP